MIEILKNIKMRYYCKLSGNKKVNNNEMGFYKKWGSSLKSEDRSLLTSDFGLLASHPDNIINLVTLKTIYPLKW